MVIFPTWVGTHKKKDTAADKLLLAQRRLKYLLGFAALELSEGASMTSLAKVLGVSHGILYYSITHGAFTIEAAQAVEDAAGRDLLRKEWLVFPLDIPTTE